MTARQMSIAKHHEIADTAAARSRELGFMPKFAPATDPRVRDMDRIADWGEWDRTDDGLIRLRAGDVGGERMTAKVQSLEGQLLITFHAAARRHSRRILIDAHGSYIMEDNGRSIMLTPDNKYWSACNAIWTARAH